MVRKISVYVIIPEVFDKLNFLVPENMTISSATKLICNMLVESGHLELDKSYRFIRKTTGMLISNDKTLKSAGITDGTELIILEV